MSLVREIQDSTVVRFLFESQPSTPFTTKRVVDASTGLPVLEIPVTNEEREAGVYAVAVPSNVTTAEVGLLFDPGIAWQSLPLTSTYRWEVSTGAQDPLDVVTGGVLLAREPSIPVVAILEPEQGTSAIATRPVTFRASAHDLVDGPLQAGSIGWMSSAVGFLGLGDLDITTLPVGVHHVTAGVVNSAGVTGTAATVIEIRAPVPSVQVTAPLSGTTIVYPQPLTFVGQATSELGGFYPAGAFRWESDVDGVLATGATEVTTSLSVGTHWVRLDVVDSQFETTSTSGIRVDVLPPQPAIAIGSPAVGSWYALGSEGTLQADLTVPPGTQPSDFPVQWISEKRGPIASGATAATTWTSIGYDTLSAVVVSQFGTVPSSPTTVVVVPPEPTVRVLSPSIGAPIVQGVPVLLEGLASDPVAGPCPPSQSSWESSVQGSLGAGPVVITTALAPGNHELTFHAVSSTNQPVSTSVVVTVAPRVPQVAILAPASGTPFTTSTPVLLAAEAVDAVDGELPGEVVAWSVAGLGWTTSGNTAQLPPLSPGSYVATATATNTVGGSSSSTAAFVVTTLPVMPAVTVIGRLHQGLPTLVTTLTVTLTQVATGRAVSSGPPGPGGPGTYRCAFPASIVETMSTTELEFDVGYADQQGNSMTGITTRIAVPLDETTAGPVVRDLKVGNGP